MPDNIELIYFDLQGRATLPRLLLRMSGVKWTDTLVPNNQEAWNERRAEFERDALGVLPVLKVNGEVFYQTAAITDYAAHLAGILPTDPMQRMKEIMLRETFFEAMNKGFTAGVMAGAAEIGLDKRQVQALTRIVTSDDDKEKRNRVMMPTMVNTCCGLIAKVEKTFKTLNVSMDKQYIFGDRISLVDLDCVFWYLFFNDAFVNNYIDAKKSLEEHAPTVVKFAKKAMKHPAVAEYIAAEGANPFLGINTLW